MPDLAAFLAARLDEDEKRLRGGFYTNAHMDALHNRLILGGWVVSRQNDVSSQLNDQIIDAAFVAMRELFDGWQQQEAEKQLAEVAAKRALVADYLRTRQIHGDAAERIKAAGPHGPFDRSWDDWSAASTELVVMEAWLRVLAAPYATHPDYDESWRIDG